MAPLDLGQTLLSRLKARVSEGPDQPAIRFVTSALGDTRTVTTVTRRELFERAENVARGLLELTVEPGARCAILCETRLEWIIADIAACMAGLISVPLFPNVDLQTLARTLEATDCRVAIAENPWQARKLLDLDARTHARIHSLVLIDTEMTLASGARASLDELGASSQRIAAFGALESSSRANATALDARIAEASPDACVTLCHTPGTEGHIKVVTWTHANMVAAASAFGQALGTLLRRSQPARHDGDDTVLLALPLAQALGRVTCWAALSSGLTLALPRSETTLFEDLPSLFPAVVIGVPSLFERARRDVMRTLRDRGTLVARASRWSVEPRREGLLGFLQARVSEGLVSPLLRQRFGSRARVFISAGAPLREGLQAFYIQHGIPLRQGYGLVETAGLTHLDVGEVPVAGEVGTLLDGVENRLGTDSELLVRGPSVTPGYWRDPEATRRALEDGWLSTGDLGAFSSGRLAITGRKRDVIVLDNGRVLAPLPIERQLLEAPLVSQAIVLGDKRDFPVALIVLDPDELSAFARSHGLNVDSSPQTLSRHPKVHAQIEHLVARINQGLPTQAQLRKFAVLPEPFSVSAGELTECDTPRRGTIAERYRTLIDSFYAESY